MKKKKDYMYESSTIVHFYGHKGFSLPFYSCPLLLLVCSDDKLVHFKEIIVC